MHVSRMNFFTVPGKTADLEQHLDKLAHLVEQAGGKRPRVMRTHFASLGSPDIVFEQEADDLATLETQINEVLSKNEFQEWSKATAQFLSQTPKREVYKVI